MGAEQQRLHIALFPTMAAGHMIPILDIAKIFSSHYVKTTIITTPKNVPFFSKPLKNYNNIIGTPINIEIIPFPSKQVGLPEGIENFHQFSDEDTTRKFMKGIELLQEPLEKVIEKCKPDCLVADMFMPYSTEVATKFNIPRLVFHGGNFFAHCVLQAIMKYEPHKSISSNDEEFIIPNLPHEITLVKSKLPDFMRRGIIDEMDVVSHEWMKLFARAFEAEKKSYGVIMNTFYELEPDYADYYRNVMGKKSWHIGPVSLCNREIDSKFQRGKDSSINEHECLKWLDSKKPNSVVYVCFGSMAEISTSQLHEIAKGLEASEQDLVWVVRRKNKEGMDDKDEDWLPQGFEKRIEGKGLIIRGWAPQVLILDHKAVGSFVTHCGWNSILEGVSCGVPMVTWPVFAEQFYNEKLVCDILKIGVSVGAKEWNKVVDGINWENIEGAVRKVMVSEQGLEIRSRAKKIKELARKAVEIGGSSYSDLSLLIQELTSIKIRV